LSEIITLNGVDKSVRVGGLGCKCEGWENDCIQSTRDYR